MGVRMRSTVGINIQDRRHPKLARAIFYNNIFVVVLSINSVAQKSYLIGGQLLEIFLDLPRFIYLTWGNPPKFA